jgi:hypothetical protein
VKGFAHLLAAFIYEELACPGKKEGAQPTLTRAMTIPTKVQPCNLPRAITISDMDHRGGTWWTSSM